MRVLKFLTRLLGWLLTPLVESAASFFGEIGGAVHASGVADPVHGLILSAACALIAALVVTAVWLKVLRKSPEVREVLGVDEAGVPEALFPAEVLVEPENEGEKQ